MESAMERKRQHVGGSLTWSDEKRIVSGHCRLLDPGLPSRDANVNAESIQPYELGSLETRNRTRSRTVIDFRTACLTRLITARIAARLSAAVKKRNDRRRLAPVGVSTPSVDRIDRWSRDLGTIRSWPQGRKLTVYDCCNFSRRRRLLVVASWRENREACESRTNRRSSFRRKEEARGKGGEVERSLSNGAVYVRERVTGWGDAQGEREKQKRREKWPPPTSRRK